LDLFVVVEKNERLRRLSRCFHLSGGRPEKSGTFEIVEGAHQLIVTVYEGVHFVQGTDAHGTGATSGCPEFAQERSGAVIASLTLSVGDPSGERLCFVVLFRSAYVGEAAVGSAAGTVSLVWADFFRAGGALHAGTPHVSSNTGRRGPKWARR
jgi:hypothetical protein